MEEHNKMISQESTKGNVSIYINGGNVQVLPNATEAVQYVFCVDPTDVPRWRGGDVKEGIAGDEEENEAMRVARGVLCIYYPDKKELEDIIHRIADCPNASDLANLVVNDMQKNTILSSDRMVSKDFIESLQQFLTFKTGASTGNIRTQINNERRR